MTNSKYYNENQLKDQLMFSYGALKETLDNLDSVYSLIVLSNGDSESGSTDNKIKIWNLTD
ncbi:hypothetical protein BpHYR1_002327 [Brachionus plicatilis]|uniref:Uncharacterized protein n=1 Tax=Brachionus plicatilis TaxID=10195 RepID=A0A3M7SYN7_BRAPC|nr:hypothetical protein BpHYR1_002327 [Brachionus plicatilis]